MVKENGGCENMGKTLGEGAQQVSGTEPCAYRLGLRGNVARPHGGRAAEKTPRAKRGGNLEREKGLTYLPKNRG